MTGINNLPFSSERPDTAVPWRMTCLINPPTPQGNPALRSSHDMAAGVGPG